MKHNKHQPYLILSNKNLGFIPLITILYAVLATTAVSGIGYGAYRYNETLQENKVMKVQLSHEKDKEISKLQEEIDQLKKEETPIANQEITEDGTLKADDLITNKQEVEIITETPKRSPGYIPVSERTNQNNAVVSESEIQQQKTDQVTEVLTAPKEEQNNVRLLTQEDRDYFASEAQKVVKFDTEALKLLEDKMKYIRQSNYREEYLNVEQAILATKKIYESDKKMAENIILATTKAEDDDYFALGSAYEIFISSAQETLSDTEFMFASINNLMQLSNDVVEAIIKLEVIDELSAEYGISSYGNSDSLAIASANTREATKKADDYVKSLMDKHNDMEKVNNYLIGIIIFY